MLKKIMTSSLILMSTISFAGVHGDMQYDCRSKQISFAKNKVWLNQKGAVTSPQLYVIHNISKQSFWINHDNNGKPMSAGWSSLIDPDKWSALKMSQPKFNLTCMEITSAGTHELDCAKLIRICLVKNAQFAKDDKLDSYWLTENQTKDHFYHNIVLRGVTFQSN